MSTVRITTTIFVPPDIMVAAIAPEKPNTDPTERSIPPTKITKVIPVAITAFIEVCLRMVTRFPVVKNLGSKIEITTDVTSSTMNGLFFKSFNSMSFNLYSLPYPLQES